MENASKALLIAAGVMIGLIVITMMIYAHNQISNYYTTKEKETETEQLAEFNKQYIGYNRNDVRGSDLISLINKIIDYNVDKINYTNDEKIEISIKIDNTNGKAESFFHNYEDYYNGTARKKLIVPGNTYTHEGKNSIYSNLINPAYAIEAKYTQALATKLTTKISTLMDEYSPRITKEDLFVELKIDPKDYNGGGAGIQEDILKYYQYIQFKRAHFDCTELTYKNGRIKSFTFKFNGTFE